MKYISLSVLLILFLTATLTAQNVKEVKIDYCKTQATSYEKVIVQATVIQQVDSDEFILKDETGIIKMELEGAEAWEFSQGIIGAVVRIYGAIDRDGPWDNAELKVFKLRIITKGTSSNNSPGNF